MCVVKVSFSDIQGKAAIWFELAHQAKDVGACRYLTALEAPKNC